MEIWYGSDDHDKSDARDCLIRDFLIVRSWICGLEDQSIHGFRMILALGSFYRINPTGLLNVLIEGKWYSIPSLKWQKVSSTMKICLYL